MEQQRHVRDSAAGPAPLPGGNSGAQVQQQAAAAAEPLQEAPGGQAPRRRQLYDDDFMIWVWKIEMCKRTDQHDRKECPYAHPGELARRRHPSLYQALPCPEARAKKICPRLESCNCSHSTFEFWLHPDRYKTFMCELGEGCDRPTCFFAHSPAELRELPQGMQRTTPAPRPPPQAAGSSSGSSGRLTGPGSQQSGAGPSRLYAAPGPSRIAGAGPSSSAQHYPRSGPPLQQYPAQHRGQASSSVQQGGDSRQQGPYQQPMYPGAMQQEAGCVAGGAQDTHRGPTVAVIPAGRSVWQNNSALQSESGEAPNLEELCAAVTRMAAQQAYQGQPRQGQPHGAALSAALQQQQQQQQQQELQQHQQRQQHQQHLHQHQHHQLPYQHQQPLHQHRHQHQHQHQQPGLPAASAMPPPQYPYPLMRVPQVMPGRVPLSGYPPQQRQQQPGQQPMQQQVMLPGGQVVFMQMVPPGEPGAADQNFRWALPRQ